MHPSFLFANGNQHIKIYLFVINNCLDMKKFKHRRTELLVMTDVFRFLSFIIYKLNFRFFFFS